MTSENSFETSHKDDHHGLQLPHSTAEWLCHWIWRLWS